MKHELTLVNREITAVAEYDGIAVVGLGIIANGACRVFRRERQIGFRNMFGLEIDIQELSQGGRYATHQVEPLFLQSVHHDLEDFIRDSVQLLLLPFCVYCI